MLQKQGLRPIHLHYGFLITGEFVSAPQLAVGAKIHRRDEPWNVIVLVRKPLVRNLSAFFHSLRNHYHKDILDVPLLLSNFEFSYDHNNPQTWFDFDFKQVYRFNLLEQAFDPEKGWARYQEGPYRFLVIRTEDLDRVGREAFQDFLGIAQPQITHTNKTNSQWYAAVKKRLKVSEGLFNHLISLPYARHFYTEEELLEDSRYVVLPEKNPYETVDKRPLS